MGCGKKGGSWEVGIGATRNGMGGRGRGKGGGGSDVGLGALGVAVEGGGEPAEERLPGVLGPQEPLHQRPVQ